MVAEALTLVGLNFPQSREGARIQEQENLGWTSAKPKNERIDRGVFLPGNVSDPNPPGSLKS
jgi:hypothetical protein